MFKRITVALDESQQAARALNVAFQQAKLCGASVSLISVIELVAPQPLLYSLSIFATRYSRWQEDMRATYAKIHASARRLPGATGLLLTTHITSGDEVDSILEAARNNRSDLLVLGMPPHTWFHGETVKQIMERAPCAVLGIR